MYNSDIRLYEGLSQLYHDSNFPLNKLSTDKDPGI